MRGESNSLRSFYVSRRQRSKEVDKAVWLTQNKMVVHVQLMPNSNKR